MSKSMNVNWVKKSIYVLISILFFLTLSSPSECAGKGDPQVLAGGIISENAIFNGEVVVSKDLYIPPGITVRFGKGAVIKFRKSESTKVEPENFLPGTEITIRGSVVADDARLLFGGDGGLVVDGGSLSLKNSSVSKASFGILLISGKVETEGTEITDSETGIMIAGHKGNDCDLKGKSLLVKRCKRGAILPEGFRRKGLIVVKSPLEYDFLSFESHFDEEGSDNPDPVDDLKKGFSPGEVIEDLFLDRDVEWRGDVLVKGVVRVAPGAHLKIKPGSRVFFDYKDSNGDGIGESGLFLQGTLIVEGTEADPVIFGSASGSKRGLWDSINFMASDMETNRIENAVILESYRGLHSHFSDVQFRNVRIYRAYRGIQFQESKVKMDTLGIFDSISALWCRDSDVEITGFHTAGNVSGSNFLRVKGTIRNISLTDNLLYGLRIRECDMVLTKGSVTGGLYSVTLQEAILRIKDISQAGAVFAGLRAQESKIEIDNGKFHYNKIYGLSFKDGNYLLKNIKISGSGVKKMNLEGKPEIIMK